MHELPDYLPGNPPMYGVKQQAVELPQGFDIILPIDLSRCPVPDLYDYHVFATIKNDLNCGEVEWSGDLNDGGIVLKHDHYYLIVKLKESEALPAGTYYLAVTAQKKINPETLDAKKILIFERTLAIRKSAGGEPVVNLANAPIPDTSIGIQTLPISYLSN